MYRENQIEASKKTRPSSVPCSDVPEKRRIEYENRAAELKRELTKQRMVLKMQSLKSGTANKRETCKPNTKLDSDGAKSSIVYENKFGKPKASSTMINYNCERSKNNVSRGRPATKILRRCPIVNTKCKVFTNSSKNLMPPYNKGCEPCTSHRKKNITNDSDGIYSEKSKNYFDSLNGDEQFLDNCLKNMKHSKQTKAMKRKCGKTINQPIEKCTDLDELDFPFSKPMNTSDGDDHGFELVERLLEREHVLDKVQIPPRLLPTTNDYENDGAAFDKLNEFFKFIDNVEQQIGEQATKDQSSKAILDADKRGPISRNNVCMTSKDKLRDQIHPKCTQTKRTLNKNTSRSKRSIMPEAITRSGSRRNEMNKSMKRPDECPNKESKKGPIACNPIVAIAQQMIESTISHSGLNNNRYTMLYTCLEWALSQCPSTNDIPLEMRIMNAIMHWGPELDTLAYAATKPNTIIIKPGEIDPESVTIIKVKEHANTESTNAPEDEYNIGHDTNFHNDEKSKNCEFNEHYLPETRVVNAVPSSQNPQVAELDMCKARVIRNMEQYMTPLNVMEN